MKIKVGIVSAEPSGDLLGFEIIKSLRGINNEVEVIGIGDGHLLRCGDGISSERSLLKIMGLVDPLKNYSKIKPSKKSYKKIYFREN